VDYKWLPVVDEKTCTGCAICVEACGPRSLSIINNLAVLTNSESCGSEEHCIEPCPEQAIRMAWLPWEGSHKIGKWRVSDLSLLIL